MFPIITPRKIIVDRSKNLEDNAVFIAMAYPEEPVRTTEGPYSALLRFVGMGKKGWVRAGHACLIVIKKGSDTFEYFDFGRYITPLGWARARSVNTDPETVIDVKAKWKDGKLDNLEELFAWLYKHPEKTRGEGDLYASISENANYERLQEYTSFIINNGIMRYGPFDKEGTNCVRFVSDALLNCTLDKRIYRKVSALYALTPSVLTNVGASSSDGSYYVASENGVIHTTKNITMVQASIIFDKGKGYENLYEGNVGKLEEPVDNKKDPAWRWLPGVGYGVWYDIKPVLDASDTGDTQKFDVSQYSTQGNLMWRATFETEGDIVPSEYQISYPSHYGLITLQAGGKLYSIRKQLGLADRGQRE